MPTASIRTPLGWLTLTEADGAITRLAWGRGGADRTPLLTEAAGQLAAYFAHERERFDLPLRPSGDAFQ